jgi:hypothetical protein
MKIVSSLLYITVLIFIITFSINGQTGSWRVGEKQIKIPVSNQEEINLIHRLKLNTDFHGPTFDHITAYVTPTEIAQIEALGIPYIVEIENLNQHSIDNQTLLEAYHSYQEIIDLADSLATNFPGICKKFVFGYSIENRQLAALKISDNVSIDESEPEVMFDGGIHGDEVGGPENIIRFARDLCLKYSIDPTVTYLINNREIWLYLMVNPDGRVHDVRYNANGVDLNRDWPYMWDAWGGSPGPCSQVESKALRECMYNNQFVVHTTYHSGTEYISCPWSYRSDQPLDWAHIIQLAGLYSSASGYTNLEYGQGNSGMYPINGSTKDGNYGMMGAIAWSMEISYSKHPPTSQIMQYYNWNYPSMIAMIEYAGYGLDGIVTDAITGDPVAAVIFVNDYFPTYSDPTAGDYHKYVLPGTYSITVVANGYQSQTINNIVVTPNSATSTNFQLQSEDGQFVYKFSSSQIEGNNEADEGLTPAVIGSPDNINYSIGKSGWCVLDMQYPIADGPGPDFIVHEGDASPEGFICYVGETIDGPWLIVGTGTGSSQFDIAVSGLIETQFIKIVDDGDGSAIVPDAGFDLDAIEALEPVSGVYLTLSEYIVDDNAGNNNGKIDPGETVDIIVTLKNNGDLTAENIDGIISSTSGYLTIVNSTANFGTLAQGQTGQGTYTVTADALTPNGEQVEIDLDVTANSGTYTNAFLLIFVIGQVPVLIIDLDENHNSGPTLLTAMQDVEVAAEYMTSFPTELSLYTSVFVCLGIFSDNHVLTTTQGQALADYLNSGGSLYMEGGDTWYYDDQTAVHPMFNIQGLSDGSGDLSTIIGQSGTFTEGMSFSYAGDNSWIDHISPITPANTIFANQSPAYNCAVAYDATNYKTIGASFEFGGLVDGSSPSTKAELISEILDFFDVSTTNTFQLSVDVTNGWNMLSIPGLHPVDQNVNTWWQYRDQSANVFKYGPGYQQVTTANPGTGYWVKHLGDTAYNYPAIQIVTHDPIPGISGWNLFGGYELVVGTAGITTIPPGLQSSPIYKYGAGYQVATTLDPGYGYWMKLTAAGQIIIPETLAKEAESVEYFPENWGKIVLKDAAGINYTLYAVKGEVDLSQYELPPAPPTGMFDIRFGSGRIAEDLNSAIKTIEMSGVTYPLTVRVEGMDIRLQDETGRTLNVNLKAGENVVISDATIQKLMVTGELIPAEYALEQNYPNPFNPSTVIEFSLPEEVGNVQLSIYNTLGEKVAELVNTALTAGKYQYQWNANNAATGMYIYELRTDIFVSVKKMLLLK